MNRPSLDLTKRHFTRPLIGKGVTVIGTWWRNDNGQHRPCLVLLPTNRKVANGRVKPCVVTVDDAYKWDIGDTKLNKRQRRAVELYISNAGRVFAENLGLGDSALAISTVINIVHDELGELMNIPPLPPGELVVVADGFVRDQDGREIHREIFDRG